MDDFISEANKKGLQVVDHNNTERLEEDFSDKIAEAELLAEKDSTEAQPFEHKYKARELLDQLCSQLEATKSIAMLEAKKGVINCMNWRIASVKVRIGTLSWECEEPHNAQTELEAACSFYFNDITTDIDAIVAKQGGDESTDDVTVSDIEELIPPIVCEQPPHSAADAMKCLNMLGILWAGRGQVRKSFLYLMAANNFYHLTIDSKTNSANSTKLPKYVAKELNVVYTHNIFYLAQAYGNLGDVKKSSYYCKLTLQRQLNNGLQDVKSSMDWAKNCASISDFYKTMRQFNNCALALASAEKIMKENVIKIIYDSIAAKDYTIDAQKDTQTTNSTDGGAPSSAKKLDGAAKHHTAAVELEAEIHKKWAALDVLILKRAYEQLSEYRNAQELGIDISKLDLEDPDSEDDYKYPLKETGEPMNSEEVNASLFEGMWVHPTPLLSSGSIAEFEQARKVFLRAASRIEAAKKHFVLDGYVTEHVLLLQQHSKLYHYLSLFETDTKRKLAMESRRLEMLTPLLKSLNIAAYEILHKQISYELGETAMSLLEIKLDKLRGKTGSNEIQISKLKKAEIAKCNEYCKISLAMFGHFTQMYAHTKDRTSQQMLAHYETLPLHELLTTACREPDLSLISEEEVRPFLNGHFLSCRIMSKIIPAEAFLPSNDKSIFLVACLRRYEWLAKFAPMLCERRGVNIADVFGEELKICNEMKALLPSKIDRMCFLGEDGLSL